MTTPSQEAGGLAGLAVDRDAGADTTDDAFLGGGLVVSQPRRGYRAGLDAVLLAATAGTDGGSAEREMRVLDAGAGVGVIGLCVAHRLTRAHVTLLEREPELARLARANAARARLEDRVTIEETDLLASGLSRGATVTAASGSVARLEPDSFDLVLANPPFYAAEACRLPRDPLRAAAHAMSDANLDDWLRALARLARPRGVARVIHRAEALPALIAAFERRFGDLAVLPIHPRAGAAANRVIVSGRKGSRGPLRILPGLVLHDASGAFMPDVARVLRSPSALAGFD